MASECKMIRYLRELAERKKDCDVGLAIAAEAALNIVADLRENFMTDRDAAILHLLVDEIRKSGHEALLGLLHSGVPDCDICAALAACATD